MKDYDISMSFRHNGFGFMCLWIKGWFGLQIGTIKLMIVKSIPTTTIRLPPAQPGTSFKVVNTGDGKIIVK